MAINEPAVESARLVGSKPRPETISKQKGSTKILIDSCRVFLKYAKREQVKEMRILAGSPKSDRFRLAKQQLGSCMMLFCTVSLPSLHIYDVKLRNFTLYGGREHKTTIFVSFCEVRYSPL